MNNKTYNNLIKSYTKDRHDLGNKKNDDYAGDTDRLANFKRLPKAASLLGVHPSNTGLDYALFMALMKIDRILNVLANGEAKNESVEDSFKDLSNYVELAYALYKEGEH